MLAEHPTPPTVNTFSARRPSAIVSVPVVAWHPDPATFATISAAPALPNYDIRSDAPCHCGRQLLDATDSPASGHDGKRVVTWQGRVYGSAKCAAADYDAGPDDREVPGARPQPRPVQVPLVLPYGGVDQGALLASFADVTRRLLDLDDHAESWGEAELVRGDARQLLAQVGIQAGGAA